MTVQEPATGVESRWARTFPPAVHRYDVGEYRLVAAVAEIVAEARAEIDAGLVAAG